MQLVHVAAVEAVDDMAPAVEAALEQVAVLEDGSRRAG